MTYDVDVAAAADDKVLSDDKETATPEEEADGAGDEIEETDKATGQRLQKNTSSVASTGTAATTTTTTRHQEVESEGVKVYIYIFFFFVIFLYLSLCHKCRRDGGVIISLGVSYFPIKVIYTFTWAVAEERESSQMAEGISLYEVIYFVQPLVGAN